MILGVGVAGHMDFQVGQIRQRVGVSGQSWVNMGGGHKMNACVNFGVDGTMGSVILGVGVAGHVDFQVGQIRQRVGFLGQS